MATVDEAAQRPPRILTREDGATIAYHALAGRAPGVVFLTGFRSNMTGEKALALESACRTGGQAFVRFDYFGHGASSGAFVEGTIGRWLEDALAVLDRLTAGPQVLVGSSMGGWIMLLAALARPRRVAGLIGTAPAPDFTEDLIAPSFSAEQKNALERRGVVELPSPYDPEPTPITRRLIEEGRRHLLLRATLPIDVPVRLLHGMADPDVPWRTSLRIAESLRSRDLEIVLVKDGDHRLSRPVDLERLTATLDRLLDDLAAPGGQPRRRSHPPSARIASRPAR